MGLRKITLPKDFSVIEEIVLGAFHYPENPDWSVQEDEREGLVDGVKNLKRLWPLVNFISIFSPALRDVMVGNIWEEEGQAAGLVLLQRRGSTNNWIVTTVGVLPEFRRRGIARKLVLAGIEMMRERDGNQVFLGVISGNLPASTLYQDVGFEKYSSDNQMEFKPTASIALPILPEGYSLESLPLSNWEIPYELEKQLAPENTQKYEPVTPKRFKRSGFLQLFVRLLNFAQGIRDKRFCVRWDETGEVVGRGIFQVRARSGGRNQIFQRLDPQHAHLAPFMTQYMLHHITNPLTDHFIESDSPAWQNHLIDPYLDAGFKHRVEFYRMGLVL